MSMTEKSAYLCGILEGLSLDETKPEYKIISKLVDIIDDMAAEIEDLKEEIDTLGDYIEEIDQDLGEVEEIVYDIDEDDCDCDCDCDCDDDDCDCGCCCDCDDDDDDTEFFCAMCPSCGEKIYFDETCDPEEVICPSCQAPLIDPDELEEE